MKTSKVQEINIIDVQPTFNAGFLLAIMVATLFGCAIALYLLPYWIPGISASLSGPNPKFFWYLSRGSAFIAYLLLWFSMVLGVGITNKLASIWPGLPPTIDLHQYTSILGLAFVIFHGVILLGDDFINFRIVQILIPFSTSNYKPMAVGLGQLSVYFWILLIASFYVRRKIGSKTWRIIHYFSFIMFIFALIHGVSSGTDTSSEWAQGIYWTTGLILVILIIYRGIFAIGKAKKKNATRNHIPGQ